MGRQKETSEEGMHARNTGATPICSTGQSMCACLTRQMSVRVGASGRGGGGGEGGAAIVRAGALLEGGDCGRQRLGLEAEGVVQMLADLQRGRRGCAFSTPACSKQMTLGLPPADPTKLHACMHSSACTPCAFKHGCGTWSAMVVSLGGSSGAGGAGVAGCGTPCLLAQVGSRYT